MEPPVKPRTFLVANIVDPLERLFVSKSILDDALPPVCSPLPNACALHWPHWPTKQGVPTQFASTHLLAQTCRAPNVVWSRCL